MLEAIKKLRENLSKSVGTEKVSIAIYDVTARVHLEIEDFYQQYNPEEFHKGNCNVVAKIEIEGDAVAMFKVRDMQGCAGIIVAYDLYVMPAFKNKKIGSAVFDFIKEFGKYYGYAIIQATDINDNQYSRKLFESKGWQNLQQFVNPKTNNNVNLWILKI